MFKYNRKYLSDLATSKLPFLWEKRIAIVLVIAAVFLLYLFRNVIEVLVVMAIFIAIGIVSMMYNRWIKVSFGFELIMLGIVITAMVYGRIPALVVGIVALFFAEVLTDRFTYSTFISFIGVFVIAMVAPIFQNTSITWVGIWMTLLYDAIILPGYILLGSSIWRSSVFFITHILFNVWVFMFIAPGVFRLLT
ncbi:hypothetical protein CMO88_04575 [Candidatus Woesearchaeota archaeon]|nr:hypothetical protein [Candidatus Woesearchaeota archaeon]|tara:strand:+ start:1310 stop:1888 length:579 start_codon:yes stop_codon:yes gene_type:complete